MHVAQMDSCGIVGTPGGDPFAVGGKGGGEGRSAQRAVLLDQLEGLGDRPDRGCAVGGGENRQALLRMNPGTYDGTKVAPQKARRTGICMAQSRAA